MKFQSMANCGCVYHAEQGTPCEHDLILAAQPRVCQHCWSKAATTSSPDLCGDCNQEWAYYLSIEHTRGQVPAAITETTYNRAEQEIPR